MTAGVDERERVHRAKQILKQYRRAYGYSDRTDDRLIVIEVVWDLLRFCARQKIRFPSIVNGEVL